MNTTRRSILVLTLLAFSACSTPIFAPKAPPQAEPKRLHDDVAWLADDAQGGRRAGTEDAARCARWIAERLKSLGLEPAGTQGYLQEFEVGLPTVDGGGSRLEFEGQKLTDPRVVAPVFCSEGPEVVGRLAFRGYGIDLAALEWNDYESADVSGAVVVLARGLPDPKRAAKGRKPAPTTATKEELQAATDFGSSGSIFTKVMTAKRHGAAGVILLCDPNDPEQRIRFDGTQSARAGIPVLFVAADALLARLGVVDLASFQDKLASGAKPEELVAGAGLPTARVFADVVRAKGPAYNVLARLRGKSSGRYVLVGAHYDHLGLGDTGSLAPNEIGKVHHGADDNASGTAAVLEMARVLANSPKLECDVVFACWSGEELGLLGSEHWASNPTLPLARLRCNLNLDMVGRAGAGHLQVLGVGTAEPFEAWLSNDAHEAGLELSMNRTGNGVGGSDHQTFLKRKIPAVHFFSGVHTDYHKPSDVVERFESDGAAKVADLGTRLIRQMCASSALAWIEPKVEPSTAQRPAAKGWRVWFGSVPEYSFEGPGVKLAGTSAGSPAEKAGLLAGDVLRQVGDVKIATIDDFMYALQFYKPGDVVEARFVRDGRDESARITLATREQQ